MNKEKDPARTEETADNKVVAYVTGSQKQLLADRKYFQGISNAKTIREALDFFFKAHPVRK